MINWRLLVLSSLIFLILALWGWNYLDHSLSEDNINVYFLQGEKLQAVKRKFQGTNKLDFALAELLKGPNIQERSAGIFTELPPDITVLQVKSASDKVTLVFNDSFIKISGGTSRINAMLAQLVFTVSELSGSAVDFQLANNTYPIIIGGEGIVIDHPLSRADFKEFANGYR